MSPYGEKYVDVKYIGNLLGSSTITVEEVSHEVVEPKLDNAHLRPMKNRKIWENRARNLETESLAKVKAQVSEVKGVMMENIEKVLDYGEKTDNLRSQAQDFK